MSNKEWNRQHNSLQIRDKKGNVVEDVVIKKGETYKIVKKFTPKQQHFINKNDEFRNHCDKLGGYVHMIYLKDEILFNKINIDKANISRIIFLATYVDFDNRDNGLLVYNGYRNEITPMDREKMMELLGLKERAFKTFLKDMKDSKLLKEEKNEEGKKCFYINTEYFNRGKVNRKELGKENKSYCRLFINTVRSLYNGCKPTKHKVLAYIYQIVPYIHLRTNTICLNPNEITEAPIKMDSKTMLDLLGIGEDKGQRSKLLKELYSFKLQYNGNEYSLFSYVKLFSQNTDFFMVNPYVVYMGNELEYVEAVANDYFFSK